MSSKYNHLLLSACLPVMAMAVCLPTPAFAGFEWTPPEETIPAPLPLETLESLEPTPPQPVLSEPLPEMEMPEDTAEPAIQIKVLDDDMEMDQKVDEAIENAIDMGELDTSKPVEETITIELEDEIEVITTETVVEDAPEMVETTTEVDVTVEVKEDAMEDVTPAPEQSTSLSINPYPLEEGAEKTSEAQAPVVLPADSDKDLGDLTAEDVNITATEPTETQAAAQEKIFWNETETFDVIEGFGSDMPLALALRQIVPAQYAFSFGQDVNPGATISWTGGQPWNSVLTAALAPLNVAFTLENKKLLLRSVEAAAPVIEEPIAEDTPPSKEASISVEDTIDDVIAAEQEDAVVEMPAIEESKASEMIVIEDAGGNHTQSAEISTPAQNIENDSLQDAIDATATEAKATPAENNAQAEPIDIIETAKEAETVEDIIAPLEPILKVDNTDDNISIKRNNIQDPGEIEAEQPVITEQPKAATLLEEKKNEVAILSTEATPTDTSGTIDYTKAALEQMAAQKIVVLDTPAESTPDQIALTEQAVIEDVAEAVEAPAQITIQEIAVLDAPVITENAMEDAAALDEIMPAEANAQDAIIPSSSFRMEPSDTIKIWEAGRKSDLRKILSQWSDKENIELVWNASENYMLDKDIFISGTFKNAIDILFSKGLKNPPKHVLAQAPSYNLRIEDGR